MVSDQLKIKEAQAFSLRFLDLTMALQAIFRASM